MSLTTNSTELQQLINANATNCIPTFGCPSIYCPQPYPQPINYEQSMKTIHIEKVPNGFIVKFNSKHHEQKRVAVDIDGLTAILREWAAQDA